VEYDSASNEEPRRWKEGEDKGGKGILRVNVEKLGLKNMMEKLQGETLFAQLKGSFGKTKGIKKERECESRGNCKG